VRTIYNLPFLSVRAPQIEKPNQDTKQKRAQSVSKYEEEGEEKKLSLSVLTPKTNKKPGGRQQRVQIYTKVLRVRPLKNIYFHIFPTLARVFCIRNYIHIFSLLLLIIHKYDCIIIP